MMYTLVQIFLIVTLFSSPLLAEIAVLPYRIDSNSSTLNQASKDYSTLISLAIKLKKKIAVTSPRDIKNDINGFGISADKTLTKDKLQIYGESRSIDYILAGTLYKTKKGFRSKNILYSVRDQKILLKTTQKAKDLFSLVSKELQNTLSSFPNKINQGLNKPVDIAFLIDSSYNSNIDIKDIKKSIYAIATNLIDKKNIDTEIYTLPYSRKVGSYSISYSNNSLLTLSKNLKKIKPSGTATGNNLRKAFKNTIQNIRWRKKSQRIVFIFSSSNMKDATFMERYAFSAEKKGIKVFSISLNKSLPINSLPLKKLASITGGNHKYITYKQILNDSKLNKIYLYLEKGRLFTSNYSKKQWQEGLFSKTKSKLSLNEHYVSEQGKKIYPNQIANLVEKNYQNRIISKTKVKNNVKKMTLNLLNKSLLKSGNKNNNIGKVLISNKNISIWIPIKSAKMLSFMQNKNRNGYPFFIGLNIKKNKTKNYGIEFIANEYDINATYISNMTKTSLLKIIKEKNFYIKNGLFKKPIWFIKVKVERIKTFKTKKDLRD